MILLKGTKFSTFASYELIILGLLVSEHNYLIKKFRNGLT